MYVSPGLAWSAWPGLAWLPSCPSRLASSRTSPGRSGLFSFTSCGLARSGASLAIFRSPPHSSPFHSPHRTLLHQNSHLPPKDPSRHIPHTSPRLTPSFRTENRRSGPRAVGQWTGRDPQAPASHRRRWTAAVGPSLAQRGGPLITQRHRSATAVTGGSAAAAAGLTAAVAAAMEGCSAQRWDSCSHGLGV